MYGSRSIKEMRNFSSSSHALDGHFIGLGVPSMMPVAADWHEPILLQHTVRPCVKTN